MKKNFKIVIAVIAGINVLGLGLFWLVNTRDTAAKNAVVNNLRLIDDAKRTSQATDSCVNALRVIDSAKRSWALETGITNRAPTWNDLVPFLGRGASNPIPICPLGGTYTIGDLTTLPSCSIPGHKLTP